MAARKQFEPGVLAAEIVGATLQRRMRAAAEEIAEDMRAVADEVKQDFFQRMSSMMGTDGQPFTQLRNGTTMFGGIAALGAVPWKPLSTAYALHKGTDRFWVYKLARNAMRKKIRKTVRRSVLVSYRRAGRMQSGTPLKAWTRSREPNTVFGLTTVSVGNSPDYFRRETGKLSTTLIPDKATLGGATNIQGSEQRLPKRIPLRFNMFPRITNPALAEQSLRGVRGGGEEQVTKLVGKSSFHRPLMRPLLAYYQQVLIREAWDRMIANGRFTTAQISTALVRETIVTRQLTARREIFKKSRFQSNGGLDEYTDRGS